MGKHTVTPNNADSKKRDISNTKEPEVEKKQHISPLPKSAVIEERDDHGELEKELAQIGGVILPKKQTASTQDSNISKPIRKSSLDPDKYPEKPTILFLSTIKRNRDPESYDEYVLGIEPKYYKSLFRSSGLDTEFLKFFFEAALRYLNSHTEYPLMNNIIANLELFPQLPRFSIASMFLASSQVKKVCDKIKSVTDSTSLHHLYKIK
ncbi:unnamed protein product [Ambrosiozyma monospora]|uniref:Unnamed protein product n=1 Tax=Ambrosiozyma monospora TaxID=43982 RepID=A0ACB5T178_AMBMO|nr:unnamed protein product [Ambrosiozyma monospora]